MSPTVTRRRRYPLLAGLLAAVVVLVAMVLLTPEGPGPAGDAVTAVPAPVLPAPSRQPAPQPAPAPRGGTAVEGPTTTVDVGGRQVTFDARGLGPLGDLARRVDGDPLALGRVDAPVVLVEYADYGCPYCAAWARTQQAQLRHYVDEGVLRIEWRDLVIFGERSQRAAQAARAAGLQGRYWAYHDLLLAGSPATGHPDLSDAVLERVAVRAGVADLPRWRRDLESAQLSDAVVADTTEARRLGARSTPTFAVNGVPVVGAQPARVFEQVVEAALQAGSRLRA